MGVFRGLTCGFWAVFWGWFGRFIFEAVQIWRSGGRRSSFPKGITGRKAWAAEDGRDFGRSGFVYGGIAKQLGLSGGFP